MPAFGTDLSNPIVAQALAGRVGGNDSR